MKRAIAFLVLGFVLVSGCNNPQKPSETSFRTAINRYLSKNGKACIPITQPFPIDVPATKLNDPSGTAPEMIALERAGLLRSSNTTAIVHGMLDTLHGATPAQPVKRYELTVDGKKYFQQYPTLIGKMNGFCYGQEQVDSIVKWDKAATQREDVVSDVTYTYKLEQLADWAKQPDIQRIFPVIEATLDQRKTNQVIDLRLTNKGWEANNF